MTRSLAALSLSTLLFAPQDAQAFDGKVSAVSVKEQAAGQKYKVVVVVKDDTDTGVTLAGSITDSKLKLKVSGTGAMEVASAEVELVDGGGGEDSVSLDFDTLKSRYVVKGLVFDGDPGGSVLNLTVTALDSTGAALGSPVTTEVIVENLIDEDE